MSAFVAALPMYDWPETRAETDAQWALIRDALRQRGVDAPETLARRNADLPAVPGGIRDFDGEPIAPDPATLPPDELDLDTLWRHPKLLFSQTCWGPMRRSSPVRRTDLALHVSVVGQQDYCGVEGGLEASYSSAIVMRAPRFGSGGDVPAPADGRADLPVGRMTGRCFAVNDLKSMSGFIALGEDLRARGTGFAIFPKSIVSGGHRASIRAVAEGRADVAAIDCRSWAMARHFEPGARRLRVAGWTARRLGLPYICARGLDRTVQHVLQQVLMPRLTIDRLRARLVSSGIAGAADLRGCRDEEIAALEARYGRFPASYRAILGLIGHGAGGLVDDQEFQMFFDQLDAVNDGVRAHLAEAAAAGEAVAQPPPNAFFISARYLEHQSCLIADGGEDSPVWTYSETMDRLTRTHDSVWDWMMGFVADAEFWVGTGMRLPA